MENHSRQKGNIVMGLIIIGAVFWGISSLFFGDKDEEYDAYATSYNYGSYGSAYSGDYDSSASYGEDYQEYPAGFSGSDNMEACNSETGRCYDLEIDSDGQNIERINFPNGGWRDIDYSECEDGYCVVEDEDGTEWELQY